MVVGRITFLWSFLSALILPTMVVVAMAALIAPSDTPHVVPLSCGITWTRIGGVTWFMPANCPSQTRPASPAPNPPPPGPDAAPGAQATP
jgi:hypothetical protein